MRPPIETIAPLSTQNLSHFLPKVLRLVPGVLWRRLDRFLCLDRISRILFRHGQRTPLAFVASTLADLGARWEVQERRPGEVLHRPVYFSNHPFGGLDGLILMHWVGERHGVVRLMANRFLTHLKPLAPLLVPVDKLASNRSQLVKYQELWAGAEPLVHFPAGLCSRQKGTKVEDLPWEKSFVTWARTHGRTLVPVYVSGRNSARFYRWARWRRYFGVKVNLEMFLLPQELFGRARQEITVRVGEPWPPEALSTKASKEGWSDRELVRFLRNEVYKMAQR